MHYIFAILSTITLSISTTFASEQDAAEDFDITRYMGRWYEIARFENRFERGLECVTAEYTLLSNGDVRVVNRGFNTQKRAWSEAVGRARQTSTPSLLRVSFFLFFYSDYRILALGEGGGRGEGRGGGRVEGGVGGRLASGRGVERAGKYKWALVGSKSPKYLWVLSRTAALPKETMCEIVEIATSYGYDTAQLKFVDHRCE